MINNIIYKSPVKVLTVFIILTITVFILNGWALFSTYKNYSKAATDDLAIHKNIGKIIHLDEVLTMSARMCAATGDKEWESRYRKYEPVLDSIIKKTMQLAPKSYDNRVVSQTDDANIKLVEMEKQSFEMVRHGNPKAARDILFSDEYENQKYLYKDGMDKIMTSIDNRIDDELSSTKSQMIILASISVICLLFLTLVWIYILVLLRGALQRREQIEEELRVSKSEIERIVVERTGELQVKSNELEELNKNLEKRVREETEARRQQEQILIQQSKIAAMGEMIGAIAHQWRQPLNALGIMVQDIKDAYQFGELNEIYISKTVMEAMEQIQYMSKTIDDFRNFYRTSKDKELFNVIKAVKSAISLHDAQLKNDKIDLKINSDNSETYDVNGYPNEFKQVILNIISNARSAILEARAEGLLKKENGEILINLSNEEGDILVSIANNGKTIPDEIKNRIFEPYFTTKNVSEGTGIGLYMSKTIIEQNMSGKLYADNTDEGVAFTILLSSN